MTIIISPPFTVGYKNTDKMPNKRHDKRWDREEDRRIRPSLSIPSGFLLRRVLRKILSHVGPLDLKQDKGHTRILNKRKRRTVTLPKVRT